MGKFFSVGWLDGEDDSPLPKRAGMMMKYLFIMRTQKSISRTRLERKMRNGTFFGLSVLSSPINQTLSYIAAKMLTKGGFFYGTSKI